MPRQSLRSNPNCNPGHAGAAIVKEVLDRRKDIIREAEAAAKAAGATMKLDRSNMKT
jgi:hypothetical protein